MKHKNSNISGRLVVLSPIILYMIFLLSGRIDIVNKFYSSLFEGIGSMSNIFLSPLALSLVGSYIVLSLALSLLWKYKVKRLIKPEWNIEKEKDDE